jgi:hypothetical protein
MADLVGLLKEEQKVLIKTLAGLEKAIEALSGDVVETVKRGNKMSEATKKKLSAAAKKRWAAIKKSTS